MVCCGGGGWGRLSVGCRLFALCCLVCMRAAWWSMNFRELGGGGAGAPAATKFKVQTKIRFNLGGGG